MSTEPRSTDSRRTAGTGVQLPLNGIGPAPALPKHGEQLSLLGEPMPIRVPSQPWRSWLADPTVVARLRGQALHQGRPAVLALARRGQLHRTRVLLGSEPAGGIATRNSPRPPVRLPARQRGHTPTRLVWYRGPRPLPLLRRPLLHQRRPPQPRYQRAEPHRMGTAAPRPLRSPRRCPRGSRPQPRHRLRRPHRARPGRTAPPHRCAHSRR